MKRIFLTTVMALVTVLSVAQEIKIKKGKISLDGVEVALLEKKKLVYTISTLDNMPKFSVEPDRADIPHQLAQNCILCSQTRTK